MSEELDSVVSPPGAARLSWSQVWAKALTSPSVETYRGLLRDPGASPRRAFIWMFLCALIGSLLASGRFLSDAGTGGGSPVTNPLDLLCPVPIGTAAGVVALVIWVAITHLTARALGGTGSYNHLLYAFAAFSAPLGLVNILLGNPSFLSWLGLPLLIYEIALEVTAVQAVHGFRRGRAIVTALIPGVMIFLLALCVIAAVIGFAPQG